MKLGTNSPFNLGVQFWKRLGAFANSLIQNDMTRGVFQTPDGKCTKPLYNEQYARYKANGMRRFSKTKVKKESTTGIEYLGRTQAKTAIQRKGNSKFVGGDRLKAYYGKPISSTNTSFVDMTLTGTLKKSLKVKTATDNSVTCGYDVGENATGKILGNREYGREIVGLNDENKEKVRQELINEMNKRMIQFIPRNISIEVKF